MVQIRNQPDPIVTPATMSVNQLTPSSAMLPTAAAGPRWEGRAVPADQLQHVGPPAVDDLPTGTRGTTPEMILPVNGAWDRCKDRIQITRVSALRQIPNVSPESTAVQQE
jgi:hypothetical protein